MFLTESFILAVAMTFPPHLISASARVIPNTSSTTSTFVTMTSPTDARALAEYGTYEAYPDIILQDVSVVIADSGRAGLSYILNHTDCGKASVIHKDIVGKYFGLRCRGHHFETGHATDHNERFLLRQDAVYVYAAKQFLIGMGIICHFQNSKKLYHCVGYCLTRFSNSATYA